MESALVHRAVAEETDHGLRQSPHCDRVGDADGDRAALADDRIAAHEAPLEIEHVHRAAHATAHAIGAAEQLRHDLARRDTAYQRVGVFAVSADDVIRRAGGIDDAGRDRLFPGIKMQEADDVALGVLFRGALLEGARQHHIAEHAVQGFAFHLRPRCGR